MSAALVAGITASMIIGIAGSAHAFNPDPLCATPNPAPTVPNVPYRTVGGVTLYLDVYRPATGIGPFPGLLVVHGGRFESGCKGKVNIEADRAARAGFVAFAIDYRLSCDAARPPWDIDDPALCGFHAPKPVSDVKAAVRWVRANAGAYEVNPARVGAVGFSSGGNLVYMAAVTGIRGDTAPDAVAGWSGTTELGYLPDGVTVACSGSSDPDGCQSAKDGYVGCGLKVCSWLFPVSSPYSQTVAGASPTFIANSTNELMPVAEANDYALLLRAAGVTIEECLITGTRHSIGYEDLLCPAGGSVWNRTVAFILTHM
jgi:acetyl esterase/lipase